MANIGANLSGIGISAAGVAYGVVAGVTLGSIADSLLGKLVNRLGYNTPSAQSISSRAKSFGVVFAGGLLAYGSIYLLSLLPLMNLSSNETLLAIAAYLSTQSVALAAARGVFSEGEEAGVAGFFAALF